MLAEVTCEDYTRCLDEVVSDVLAAAEITAPPIDAFSIADRLGIIVAVDDRQLGRARCARLNAASREQPTIFVRSEPRVERGQWSVAHEIGEHWSERVFAKLHINPLEAPAGSREKVANLSAARLLLPTPWFRRAAEHSDWDLFQLKRKFSTASHELIARRMLDFEPPVAIAVFDHGRLTFRRANLLGMTALSPPEHACRERAARTNRTSRNETSRIVVTAWPIHEPEWRREILRTLYIMPCE